MNRTSEKRALGGLPLLSAALLSLAGLVWDGASNTATAQAYSGANNQVIVNYDVLNALPGQPAPYGAGGVAPAGGQQKSQFLPGYPPAGVRTALPPYTPYGAAPIGAQPLQVAPGLATQNYAGGLPVPPNGTPYSGMTTIGPDGRPIAPIVLKKPGSTKPKKKQEFAAPVRKAEPQVAETPTPEPTPETTAEPTAAPEQVAEVTPPDEPTEVPSDVAMPEGTPPAPAPGENADAPPAPQVAAVVPSAEEPAPEESAEQPAEATEAPAEEPAEETPPAEETATPDAAPAEEAPAEETATEEQPAEEQPAEETAAAPAEPDNTQPAAPIPQGGIRIVFPSELNEVPAEANAALDDLAAQMVADEEMRIEIYCYASGTVETESKARRKSLARCINIRQYLFKKEVRTTRMDVRALGLKSEGQPSDRVDIVPADNS